MLSHYYCVFHPAMFSYVILHRYVFSVRTLYLSSLGWILKVMNMRYNDLFKLLLNDGALMMGSREFKVIVHRFEIIIATQETHTTLTQAPQENLMTEEYLDFNSSLGSKMPTG